MPFTLPKLLISFAQLFLVAMICSGTVCMY